MNRIALFLSVSLLIWSCSGRTKKTDMHSSDLFSILKNKDSEAFVDLFPRVDQIQAMFQDDLAAIEKQNLSASGDNKEDVASLKESTQPEAIASMLAFFEKGFEDILSKGEANGIRWPQIELPRLEYDSTGNASSPQKRGTLYFTSNKQEYQVSFSQPYYLPREQKAYGLSLWNLKKVGGPNDPDYETKEIILEDIREEVPPPPPPPPPKSKS